jgi:hypothetical protein
MTYSLRRDRDGAGDSGPMSLVAWQLEDGTIKYEHDARPRVGAIVRVGTHGSRSYSSQDYWTTTPVTEILEDTEFRMRLKTDNSVYTWEILQ